MKKYKPIPKFSDHSNCKGHGNFMLDSTLETEEDRNAVLLAIESAIRSIESSTNEKNI